MYGKCGFERLPADDPRELEMALDLKRYHDLVNARIAEIMNRNVITIRDDQPCTAALDLFVTRRVASLPVVDEQGELTGIISEMDLMLPSNVARNVGDIQTRAVVSVHEDCTIAKVIRMFESKRLRCIPVVDGDKRLVGVVGRKDVLAYYAKHLEPTQACVADMIPSNAGVTFREMIAGNDFYYGAEVVTTRGFGRAELAQQPGRVRQGSAGRSADRLDFDHRQSGRRADAAARLARRPGGRAPRPRGPAPDLQGHEPQRPGGGRLALRLRRLREHPGHHRRLSDRRLRRHGRAGVRLRLASA